MSSLCLSACLFISLVVVIVTAILLVTHTHTYTPASYSPTVIPHHPHVTRQSI